MAKLDKGYFVISLDFELIYGMLDVLNQNDKYYNNLFGVREVIPEILDLFRAYSVAATWASVGMLFHSSKEELIQNVPSIKPHYTNPNLSVYKYIDNIDEDKIELFLANDLIAMIAGCPDQEIATHTYGHYYCTEPGQTIEEFDADIQQAIKTMNNNGYDVPYSIIFPRNMCNDEYLAVLERYGIRTYRGETKAWYTKFSEGFLKKTLRLIDAYINIGGYQCYEIDCDKMVNIPASRFLYHYNKIPHFDWLKLHRIKKQMEYAAIHKKVFHIWWHPHNFGTCTEKNIQCLTSVLDYYCHLRDKYNMVSANMKMLGEKYCIEDEKKVL